MEIKKYPSKILRTICEPIKNIRQKHIDVANEMHRLMKIYKGIGLAAPQVNRPYQLITINTLNKDDDGLILTMINPELLWASIEFTHSLEGCLSIPGFTNVITRSKEIKVKYIDETMTQQERVFSGMNARVIQHELDHLNGILMCDYFQDN